MADEGSCPDCAGPQETSPALLLRPLGQRLQALGPSLHQKVGDGIVHSVGGAPTSSPGIMEAFAFISKGGDQKAGYGHHSTKNIPLAALKVIAISQNVAREDGKGGDNHPDPKIPAQESPTALQFLKISTGPETLFSK